MFLERIFIQTMNKYELQARTKRFCINCIRLCMKLPDGQPAWTISSQLTRSSSSTGSNYRAACKARSDKEFISKIEIVLEEADESAFWLEIIEELGIYTNVLDECNELKQEANELVAIFTSTLKSTKSRLNRYANQSS